MAVLNGDPVVALCTGTETDFRVNGNRRVVSHLSLFSDQEEVWWVYVVETTGPYAALKWGGSNLKINFANEYSFIHRKL